MGCKDARGVELATVTPVMAVVLPLVLCRRWQKCRRHGRHARGAKTRRHAKRSTGSATATSETTGESGAGPATGAADEDPDDLAFDNEDILANLMAGAGGDEEDLLGDGTLIKSIITPAPRFTRRPQLGDDVTVHFVGTLEDGKVFDDSRQRGEPYRFHVGLEQVIKGWDKAVPTMMKGERALFTMAPELAYGEKGAGWKIPPNATVRFDIELLGFEELDDMSSEFDEPEDNDLTYAEEEGIGRGDLGPGGDDPAGRYRWERRGQEVAVVIPLAEGLGPQDVVAEFLPQRVSVAVGGEVILSGTPGCELNWEECTWDIDADFQGDRCLFVHLQKQDALKAKWPATLFKEEQIGGA